MRLPPPHYLHAHLLTEGDTLSSTKRLAIIDGDSLVYDAGLSAQRITDWGNGIVTPYAKTADGEDRIEVLIQHIQEATKSDRVVMVLSDYDTPNWRNAVMPTYKETRGQKHGSSRPFLWAHLRQYLRDSYTSHTWDGMEGDDVMGVLATSPDWYPEYEKVICSIDKDLKTIPGLLYNFHPASRELGVRAVTEVQADRYHLFQALIGDTTDGYPGCPKIGKVTGEKILAQCDFAHVDQMGGVVSEGFDSRGAWQAIVLAYIKAGLSEEVALQNARVARICRHTDYNQETGEVILWQPPQ